MKVFWNILLSSVAAEFLDFQVHLQERNIDELERVLIRVSDPTHSDYGNYLSLEQLRDLIGIAPKEYELASDWLTSQLNATNIQLSAARTHISCRVSESSAKKLQTDEIEYPAVIRNMWVSSPSAVKGNRTGRTRKQFLHEAMLKKKGRSMKASDEDTDPNSQKVAIGMPVSVVGKGNVNNTQMVWGTGTFGVQKADLEQFWSLWDVKGTTQAMMVYEGKMGVRGDNYKEGCLDSEYITGMGNGIRTVVSNTDSSADAEQGLGYGRALATQVAALSNSASIPLVLSLSIGSLSFASCQRLCKSVAPKFDYDTCWAYLTTTQHQVCMFESQALTDSINVEFMKLGVRGMSIFAASGDGGSHWAFGPFDDQGPSPALASALNELGCAQNWPVFPADSPYVTAVGGTDNLGSSQTAWVASGGGFSLDSLMPSWQQATVNAYLSKAASDPKFPPPAAFNSTARAYPDVASYAGECPVITNDSPGGLMGTSESAPAFAGIISQLNELRLNKGLSPLGFLNPRLYITAMQFPGDLFKSDMAKGSSACDAGGDCCKTGFPVLAGWNPVTGLGWPQWKGMETYLASAP